MNYKDWIKIHHELSMSMLEEALMAKHNKLMEVYSGLIRKSYINELIAFDFYILQETILQPTYSVLARSSASLAFLNNNYYEALVLCSMGKEHNPPIEILHEIEDIESKIHTKPLDLALNRFMSDSKFSAFDLIQSDTFRNFKFTLNDLFRPLSVTERHQKKTHDPKLMK